MIWSLISLINAAKEVDFNYCQANDHLGISSFVVTPDHLIAGQELTVTVSGTATTESSRLLMDFGIVVSSFYTYQIISDYDTCGYLMDGCPMQSGEWTWKLSDEIPDPGTLSYFLGVELTMKVTFRDEDSPNHLACVTFPITIYKTLPTAPPTKNPTAPPTKNPNLGTHSSNANQLVEWWIPIVAGVSAICLCCGCLQYRDYRRKKQWITRSSQNQVDGVTCSSNNKITETAIEL